MLTKIVFDGLQLALAFVLLAALTVAGQAWCLSR